MEDPAEGSRFVRKGPGADQGLECYRKYADGWSSPASVDINHLPLVDREVWNCVQDQLESNRQGLKGRANVINPSLLVGLLWDESGQKLIPTHTKRNNRRYRYYVSSDLQEGTSTVKMGMRIPAHELEVAITDCIKDFLTDEAQVLDWIQGHADDLAVNLKDAFLAAKDAAGSLERDGRRYLAQMVERIVVHTGHLEITLKATVLGGREKSVHLNLPIEIKRRGMAMRLVVNNDVRAREPDKKLLGLISKGHQWLAKLTSGTCDGVGVIATQEKISRSYVTRVIYLAFLAPDIIECIARGQHPADLNAEKLMRMVPLPEDWVEQRTLLKVDG